MRLLGAVVGSALLGWFAASLILFTVFWALQAMSSDPRAYQITAMALTIVVGSLPTALIATATLGLGWHAIAVRRQWRSRTQYFSAGAAVGVLLSALTSLLLKLSGPDWWPWIAIGTLYAAACGGLTGLYAWLMLRPDRDAAANPPRSAS